MFKRSLLLSILAIALVGVACPSATDNGEGGDSDDAITADNATQRLFAAFCQHELRCATEYGLGDLTQAECEMRFSVLGGSEDDLSLYSVNQTAARACLEKVTAAACGAYFNPELDADCRDGFVGELTEGACCDVRDGCGPGLRCKEADGDAASCVPLSAAGGDCQADADCELGLFCSEGTCATLVQSGGDCTRDDQCAHMVCSNGICGLTALNGESCATIRCAGQLWCDNGTCAALPTLGGDCSATGICAAPSFCHGGTCVAFGGLGDDCGPSLHCNLSLYCDYASVGGDDTCKTFLGQGETCNPKLLGMDCDSDLHCDAATATCEWDLAMCL